MAVALGERSIEMVEEKTDDIVSDVNKWDGYKSEFESTMNNDVGSTFTTEFTIGGTAAEKLLKTFNILIGMEGAINTLTQKTYDFLAEQRRLNEQELQSNP